MGERVSSADPSVRTYRARIERAGGTRRPRLALPEAATDDVPAGVVRLAMGGTQYRADVRAGRRGDGPVVHGVYDNPRQARSPSDGENRLPDWLDDAGLTVGRSVLFDVVVPAFLYGLRAPGETAVYDAVEPPSPSLSRIAEGLDE
ncbi:MAG: hypothetical protein ABEJ92_02860 [Halobacteriales archaeon]